MFNLDMIPIAFSAIATIIIAYYAYRSYELSQQLKLSNEGRDKREEEYRQRTDDLYQAIVVATLISGQEDIKNFSSIKSDLFDKNYNGKTEIFKNNPPRSPNIRHI